MRPPLGAQIGPRRHIRPAQGLVASRLLDESAVCRVAEPGSMFPDRFNACALK